VTDKIGYQVFKKEKIVPPFECHNFKRIAADEKNKNKDKNNHQYIHITRKHFLLRHLNRRNRLNEMGTTSEQPSDVWWVYWR